MDGTVLRISLPGNFTLLISAQASDTEPASRAT